MGQLSIVAFLCIVSMSEARVVFSGGSGPAGHHHHRKHKDNQHGQHSNTTPSLNDITKWPNEAPMPLDEDDEGSNADGFLQQDLYRVQDYGSMDLDEKMSQVLLILADVSGEIHGLRNQVGNLKFQNYMLSKQMRKLRCKANGRLRENGVIESASQTLEEPLCPDDYIWNRRLASCYRLGTDRITWRMAREKCQAQGADLVTIESEVEQRFLTEKAAKSPDTRHCDFWTGATDKAMEGQWRWTHNGQSLSYTNWKANEPNNGSTDEHCMHMMWVFGWQWNDGRCNFENVCYICELHLGQ